MNSERRILELRAGRRLAMFEFGAPDGEPVFFCHGWPGAGLQGERLHAAGAELGFRIISFDRPGIGGSSQIPERRLLDWPPMIAEVADQLGLEKFRILGLSGGGPYALATARELPARVEAASLVCGAPPIAELADRTRLMPSYRALLTLHAKSPNAVRWLFRGLRPMARVPLPRALWPLVVKFVGAADAAALADPVAFASCYGAFRGAWSGSRDGVFEDAQIYAQPWGFAPEEIRVPVHVWHGREDSNFAWQLAEDLAARIPQAQVHILENEGHYSLPFRQAHAILAAFRTAR